ncbi:MAG TPA: tryptophan 2,3-dioxygenase family protein [Gemmataceae bacterium]|jgi:tryptophan 2,3-dioxygenase|nr:tryptophan 2,3-dioxygenase family protein [Gemmataceae bacterium]
MSNPIPTYWDYLQLLPLLNLQSGLETDDSRLSEDELHFIVVHQVFELWLKLVLRELRMARDQMAAEWVPEKHLPNVVRHLRRVNEIIKLSVSSFAVLETLTPQDFLAFRAKLGQSSGFQSFQMRELELVLGLEPTERQQQQQVDPIPELEQLAQATPEGKAVAEAIMRARSEPSLRSALLGWLFRTPIQGSMPNAQTDQQTVVSFLEEYRSCLAQYDAQLLNELDRFVPRAEGDDNESYRRLRARAALLFIESYRDLPLLSWPYLLLETVVELEELLVLWRMRHVRMVERMIGRRSGTGGSPGVAYLERTTQYRIFHEFWTVRTLLLPRDRVPPLRERRYYELMEDVFRERARE